MPEKYHKRTPRSDHFNSQSDIDVASFSNEGNLHLSEQDFEDNTNIVENIISEHLHDAEFGQKEISRLIENLSSKVDHLASTSSEQGFSTNRIEHNENTPEEIVETSLSRTSTATW